MVNADLQNYRGYYEIEHIARLPNLGQKTISQSCKVIVIITNRLYKALNSAVNK